MGKKDNVDKPRYRLYHYKDKDIIYKPLDKENTTDEGVKHDQDKPPLYYNYHKGWEIYNGLMGCAVISIGADNFDKYYKLATLIGEQGIIECLDSISASLYYEDVSRVCKYGADKYGHKNYLKGIASERLLSAALRHLRKWFLEDIFLDDESGLSHKSHAIANLLMHLELYPIEESCKD